MLLTNTGSEIAAYVAENMVTNAVIMGGAAAVSETTVNTIFTK